MRALRNALLSLTCLAAPGAALAQDAQPQVTIAVMPMRAASIGGNHDLSAIGDALTAMIATEFGNRPVVSLVERQTISNFLDQQAAAMSGAAGDRVAVELGRMVGAQYVVEGGVFLSGNTARFDIRLIDVESSRIHRSFRQTGRQEDFLSLVDVLANEFLRDLRLPVRVADVPVPPAAALVYSRGLDYERRGDRRRAADMYRRTLELFPSHKDATAALARVR